MNRSEYRSLALQSGFARPVRGFSLAKLLRQVVPVIALCVTIGGLILSPLRASGLEIIKEGKPLSQIVVSPDALPQVKFAAKELQEHLEKMTGARLPIVTSPGSDFPASVFVGESEHTKKLGITTEGLPMEGYKVVSKGNHLVLLGRDGSVLPVPRGIKSIDDRFRLLKEWQTLTGEKWDIPRNGIYDPRFHNAELDFSLYDPTGTLFAVYDLLEQLGVRWYLPYHDFGTILPKTKEISVPEQQLSKVPAFQYRFMRWSFPSADIEGFLWAKRQKIGMAEMIWLDHGTSNVTRMAGKSNPEYFATVGGQLYNELILDPETGKALKTRGSKNNHLPRLALPLEDALVKYSDFFFQAYPEMRYIPVGPSDALTSIDDRDAAAGWLREDRGHSGRMSDYVWSFENRVAERISKNHPGKIALGLAYTSYRLPPETEHLHPGLGVCYCQTRTAEMLTPEGKERLVNTRNEWLSKLTSGEFYIWEYNLAQLGPGLSQNGQLRGVPVFCPTVVQADLKSLQGKSKGEFVECGFDGKGRMLNPGLNHLPYYLQARLYWEPDLDLKQVIKDYCNAFYGPAAEEMAEFWRFAEEVWTRPLARQITLTGGFLRPADVDRFFEILARAQKKAGESEYGKRIALIAKECAPMQSIFPNLKRQGPDFIASRTNETPVVDGDLSKSLWTDENGAPREPLYRMVDSKTGEKTAPETTVQFRWAADNSGLYVAVSALEPKMSNLNPQAKAPVRDSLSIYDNDFVEVFLETESRSTFRFVINADGAIYDNCTDSHVLPKGVAWNADWKVGVKRRSDRWDVELFIPRQSLDNAKIPAANEPWGINICRSRFLDSTPQNSAISPTGGRFFQTAKFGSVVIQ